MKTGTNIEQDFLLLFEKPLKAAGLRGGVYLNGARPHNSKGEDAVFVFLTGRDYTDCRQTGVVNLNVYVPDISIAGADVKDVARVLELESALSDTIESVKKQSPYLIGITETIKSFWDTEAKQHFINIRINYKIKTN